MLETQVTPRCVEDGVGGLYAFWDAFPNGDDEVHGQHLTSGGNVAPGWSPEGLPIAAADIGDYHDASVASDGFGGALAAFTHGVPGGSFVWATRIRADVPVPTAISFVDAQASPARVTLRWQSVDADRLAFTVYRRGEEGAWIALGSPHVFGRDLLEFTDERVAPGRYAYRLGWYEGTSEFFSELAWVDVPGENRIALGGFRPNPATGPLTLAFSLAAEGPAEVSIHDVRGRMVWSREVSSLGPGAHVLRIDDAPMLPSGVYWIALRASGRLLTTRGVVAG
jgi:hypothetical protein